jgi:methionyl-tRNA synthetase
MPEKILLGVAWPYSNGSLHVGQIVGAYLPADIFARYHRTAGNDVLMVSGSDQHGTPITVRAEDEGRTPAEVADQFHAEFLESWEGLGISWDLYTTTRTDNHAQVTQDIFLMLLENDDIYLASMELPYCAKEQRFLLDRYVEGTCPYCSFEGARGDQCDDCGRPLDPIDLIDRRCKFDGTEPELRESEHFFLRLSAYNDRIRDWLRTDKAHWRKNVVNFSLGMTEQGLKDRAITRDLEWGIRVPVEGFEDKRIYVWFENVIGYLSAAKEWAQQDGEPEKWREWWQDHDAKTYYFIGKDNIFFHALSWPMELMAYSAATGEDYNLPYDVPANQYQTIRGSKASTSQRLAVWVPEYLSRYDPDPLRYYLAATMPETSDSDFTWAGFHSRNNDELVATWGNLVNRVLTFTYKNFDASVPTPAELTGPDRALLDSCEAALAKTGEQISLCNFRAGLDAAMSAAREANRYIEANAPWVLIKEDKERCATVLYTAIAAISAIKTALYPYLPFTSQTLHGYLGQEGPVQAAGWTMQIPAAGQPLADAKPLFKKLDASIIDEEDARLAS